MKNKELINKTAEELSVRQRLGQLLMLDFRYWGKDSFGNGVPFTVMNDSVRLIIQKYNLGGIAFFRENVENPEQTIELVNSIQNAAGIPLFIGIDQEGGIVTRLQTGTDMPGNMALGAADDLELTKEVAFIIGKELNSLGINLNFAPDIDVNSNQLNPIIGIRSFGSNPGKVAQHGEAYIKGLKEAGVLSCVKHFPGHGNTVSDTHLGLATVDYSLSEMEEIDLVPFYEAFKAGTDTVMAAHVCVPSLDNSTVKSIKDCSEILLPTTFSKKILTDLLRDRMSFGGVVLTDALDMKAISDNFGSSESVIISIIAGVDMPVMPVRIWDECDIYKIDDLISDMEKEYCCNDEFHKRVDESLNRILSLKEKYNMLKGFSNCDINQLKKAASETVGCVEHKEIESRASNTGITLVVNENNLLPFKIKEKNRILILDSNSLRLNVVEKEIDFLNNIIKENIAAKSIRIHYADLLNSSLKKEMENSDLIILYTYNLTKKDVLPEAACRFAKDNGLKIVVVATRNPYDIAYIPSCPVYLAIYGAVSFDQTNYMQAFLDINLKTSVRTIFYCNELNDYFNEPIGKLPVAIKSFENNRTIYEQGFGLNYN